MYINWNQLLAPKWMAWNISMDDVLKYHSFHRSLMKQISGGNNLIYNIDIRDNISPIIMVGGKILPRYFYISSSPNKNVCTIYVYIFPAINNLVWIVAKNIIVFRVKVLFVVIKETIWPPYKMNVKAVISRLKTINTYNMECVGGWKWKVGQNLSLIIAMS